jgi:hypothetical protein
MEEEILNPKSETLILDETDLELFCQRNKLQYKCTNLKDLANFDGQYTFVHTGQEKDQFNGGNTNHWMFLYGKNLFDSYGMQDDFLLPEWAVPVQMKPHRIQEYGSNVCGEYCSTFYKFAASGIDPDDANMGLEYSDAMQLSQRRGDNDRLVQEAYLHLGGHFDNDEDNDTYSGQGIPTVSQKDGTLLPNKQQLPIMLEPSTSQPMGLPASQIPNPTRVDDSRPNQDTDMTIGTTPVPTGVIPDGSDPGSVQVPSTGRSGAVAVVNPHELHGGSVGGDEKEKEGEKEGEAKAPVEGKTSTPLDNMASLDMPAMPVKMPTSLGMGYDAPPVPADMQLLFPTIPKQTLEPIVGKITSKILPARAILGRSQVKRLNYDGSVVGNNSKRLKGVIDQYKTVQSFVPLGDIIEGSTRAMPFQLPNLTILTAVPQVLTLAPGLRKKE